MPQWIRKVVINQKEIDRDINILLAEESKNETEEFLESFGDRILREIGDRETSRASRQTFTSPNNIRFTYSSWRDTINRLQEFWFNLNINLSEISSDEEEEYDDQDIRKTINIRTEESVEDSDK